MGVLFGVAVAGCDSPVTERAATRDGDAGALPAVDASSVPPPESDPVTLTLWPFWDLPATAQGFGTPTPLDGVNVCLRKKRGYEQSFADFVDVDGPCTGPVAAGSPAVLAGIPPMSELVLTGEKEGYLPRAIAVATGQWDTDLTQGNPDVSQMHLFSRESAARIFPGADLRLGQIAFFVTSMAVLFPEGGTAPSFSFYFVGGVSASITPDAGEGPRYFAGGSFIDGATSTTGAPLAISSVAGAVLTDLPEGEYVVRASANVEFGAAIDGFGFRLPLPNEVRVPVLDGFFTEASLSAGCPRPALDDPMTCAPSIDAATP